ncbi:MAG: hypothetical protein JW929_03525 [Anaerolineales bacterium]|nr:hypothetical protein [Anaerolineales bacterium]
MTATDSDPTHTVSFSGSIGGAGFSCGAPCTQGIPDGVGTYTWKASCSGGLNVPATGFNSGTYQVDSTPPIVIGALSGGTPGLRGWYFAGPVTLNCSASDALSGLAGLTYGNQTANTEGVTVVSCTATDVAGNSADATYSVPIDSGSPSVHLIVSGTLGRGGWYVSPVTLGVEAADSVSGIFSFGLQVNGTGWTSSTTIGDGEHSIEARAEDYAGNAATASEFVKVDTTPPLTAWSAEEDQWVRGKTQLVGTSYDAGSGVAAVYVSFDGIEWKRIAGGADWAYEWDTTLFPDGDYEILARADDAAGNEEHTDALAIHVDNTPPEVSLAEEWILPDSGDAGGSDAGSGIGHAVVTVSRGAMTPWVREYDYIPAAIEWDGKDGNGAEAGYGFFQVALEVWDRAGNYSVTNGVVRRLKPEETALPTPAVLAYAAPEKASPGREQGSAEGVKAASAARLLPFWSFILPLAALGVWLAASNVAFARDRRWSELRGLGRAVARYRDQKQINFPHGED